MAFDDKNRSRYWIDKSTLASLLFRPIHYQPTPCTYSIRMLILKNERVHKMKDRPVYKNDSLLGILNIQPSEGKSEKVNEIMWTTALFGTTIINSTCLKMWLYQSPLQPSIYPRTQDLIVGLSYQFTINIMLDDERFHFLMQTYRFKIYKYQYYFVVRFSLLNHIMSFNFK